MSSEPKLFTHISYDHPKWADLGRDLDDYCTKLGLMALQEVVNDIDRDIEVSVVLANDPQIRDLNAQHRGKEAPTNVLSFPSHSRAELLTFLERANHPLILGDIVLSLETISREAQEQGKDFIDHFTHLYLHGFLHLLGYNHDNDNDAGEMEAIEIRILGLLQIDNPYLVQKS